MAPPVVFSAMEGCVVRRFFFPEVWTVCAHSGVKVRHQVTSASMDRVYSTFTQIDDGDTY